MKNIKSIFQLFICIAIPLVVGGISGFYTSSNIPTWFPTLIKPSFNPPNYVFAPVWSLLYTLMGISLFLVLQKAKDGDKAKLIGVFAIQLTLNFFWSIIFFKWHSLGYAFIEIILLWISIILMIIVFYKTNKIAGLINIPYLLWVSFASFLNYSFYVLNP